MDRAISAAPDVVFYYTTRARLMDAFEACDASDEVQIATEQHDLHRAALRARPISHEANLAVAASALKLVGLGQRDRGREAVQVYGRLITMLPGLEPVYNGLASAHLVLGQPREALAAMDGYVAANGEGARPSAEALFLRGVAHQELGMRPEAVALLERYVKSSPKGSYVESAHRRLAVLHADLGR